MEYFFLIIIGAILFSIFKNKDDETKWYGYMICASCKYRWKSRRNTPPSRCPHCNSKFIDVVYGSK